MTEEESRTKWCPMIRITQSEGGPLVSNRDEQLAGAIGTNVTCIASDCMMWIPEKREKHGDIELVFGGRCGLAR